MRFPIPGGNGRDVFSGFGLIQIHDGRPKVTLGRNYAHDEMLYVSSSTGSVFEERSKQLKNEPDIVEAIIENAKRMFGNNGE